ncbi:MAG: PKD domain-containing protein [Chitinophagales bacterium]
MYQLLRILRMKYAWLLAALCTFSYDSFGSHIIGGELSYLCVGNDDYEVTLKVYRDCYNGQAPYDDPSYVFIYNNTTGALFTTLAISFPGSDQIPNNTNDPCLIVPPNICVEEAVFIQQVHLPPTTGGYRMIYQRCCRNSTIVNITDPGNTGATYEATVPGSALADCNSSPYFVNFPPTLICINTPFVFDHSAVDPDADELVYELCYPYDGASSFNPQPTPGSPPVSYNNINFVAPYTYDNPMGGAPPMAIDGSTGELTVTPTAVGQYVVGVCVSEFRNGDLLSVHRRDFQFNVTNCNNALASINGGSNTVNSPALFNSCDGFTFFFPNNSNNATSYHWDFGVTGITNDTSNLEVPTYTFPDTGIYIVTLIANPGSFCGDTAYGIVYVYPVLEGDFLFPNGCVIDSLQFTDQSTSGVGNINYWFWNFGSTASSLEQNPVYAFDTTGTYYVQLIVGTDLGCLDTVFGFITIHEKPEATAYPDTIICSLDTVQLIGSGIGDYTWAPAYGLNSNTLQTPLASPNVDTHYMLTVTNQWGCTDTAGVQINVYDSVIAFAGNDTIICPGEIVQLNGSGGFYYSWSPTAGLSDWDIADPQAQPGASITYIMTTFIGSCIDSDSIQILVKPDPEIAAGPDQSICIGDSVMITACCGSSYDWEPAFSLADAASGNTLAFPTNTTVYHLQASDSNSCPVIVHDSIIVFVIAPPPLDVTGDTLMYLGTSATLHAYGGDFYTWVPPDFLSDPYINNPVVTPLKTTEYTVNAITAEGCPVSSVLKVTVIDDPLVTFPNAFSPNGDGLNDYLFPIVLGLFESETFKVFNRWGEMVFESQDFTTGWDGTFQGKEEGVGTYVYFMSGKSLSSGKTYLIKGNVVLLR